MRFPSAVPRDSRVPSLDYPPIRVHRFSQEAYKPGIETHLIDGVPVKIYRREKTLADCFKFRNKIGMDVVLEAVKLHKARNGHQHRQTARIRQNLSSGKGDAALLGGTNMTSPSQFVHVRPATPSQSVQK